MQTEPLKRTKKEPHWVTSPPRASGNSVQHMAKTTVVRPLCKKGPGLYITQIDQHSGVLPGMYNDTIPKSFYNKKSWVLIGC